MNYYKVYFYGNNDPQTVLGYSQDTVMNEFVEMFGDDSIDRVEPVSIHQTEKSYTQRGANVSVLTGYNPFANRIAEEEKKKKKKDDSKTININVDGDKSDDDPEEVKAKEAEDDANVEIDKDSPDANKDGKVDSKDDLNKDGKVDKKDLKIAELEKDLRIKQLEKQIEAEDDPAPEAKMKEASRLRVKDRGNSFECVDEAGNCVKAFPYDNKETYAKQARYDAQRFAEKHYAKQLGEEYLDEAARVNVEFSTDDVHTADKKAFDQIVKKHKAKKVKSDGTSHQYELKSVRDAMAFKRAVNAVPKQTIMAEGENKQVKGGDPCWPGFEMVGMKKKNGKEVPNCVPVQKEEAVMERRKFIYAAMQAKKEGKKKFLFQGKEYPVTLKEETPLEEQRLDEIKPIDDIDDVNNFNQLGIYLATLDDGKVDYSELGGILDRLHKYKNAVQKMPKNTSIHSKNWERVLKGIGGKVSGSGDQLRKLTNKLMNEAIEIEEGVDRKVLKMLKDLDTEEAMMIIQGMPKRDQKVYKKALGIKETVDGRTKAYKETVARLMAKKQMDEKATYCGACKTTHEKSEPCPTKEESDLEEAGYNDPPETKAEADKKYPDVETDVKNKESKDLTKISVSESYANYISLTSKK